MTDWFGGKCLAYSKGRTCVGPSGHNKDDHTWKGVNGMEHTVRTTHIQGLIRNALSLAERVDGYRAGSVVPVEDAQRPGNPQANVEHALCKAISDLRHAADELDAERLSCFGWSQQ